MTTTNAAPATPPASPQMPRPGNVPPAVAALDRLARGPRGDATAVIGIDGTWSFRRLAAAAGRVTGHVLAAHAPGAHLGVARRATGGFVATVLGGLRAGAAVSVVAPDSQVDPRFLGLAAVLDSEQLLDGPADADAPDLPAVPPAVEEDWAVTRFGIGADDRVALWSGVPNQVLSTIATAVCGGAALVVAPPVFGDPAAVAERLREAGVTVLVTTAPLLRLATARAAGAAWAGLRLVLVDHGGELLAADLAALRRVAPAAVAVSVYRTERSGVPLAVHVPEGAAAGAVLVPAGTPPPGSPLEIRTAAGRLAGLAEIGELCSGPTRTGDLARRLPGGTVELVGPVDGDRELDRGATLAALRALPGVHDAVLVDDLTDDGDPLRIAYLAAPGLDGAQARRALGGALPERLVPRHVVPLDVLPLTSAGLHDLDALPALEPDGTVVDDYVAPRTPLEQELCAVLQELLGAERVGVDDSFFQLGGFSLLATQLATRVRESYRVTLTLRDVFDAPTVDGLAHLIVLRQIESEGGDELDALLAEVEHAAADDD